MDDLHAAVKTYLRAQRRQLAEAGEREAAILNIWRDRYAIPRCNVCGAAIDSDEGGLYNLATMRDGCRCLVHHAPFLR